MEVRPVSGAVRSWRNFFENVACEPQRYIEVESDEQLTATIVAAARAGDTVRAHGAGHSNTPLVSTAGTLLNLRPMSGLRRVDAETLTATFGAATTVAEIGAALWEHGLSLTNQGDINAQYLAGAVSTGTHGTGIDIGSFSGSVRALRLACADGVLRDIGSSDEELLRAARTSLGALGVLTEITVTVQPAFALDLRYEVTDWTDLVDRWDALLAGNRHFAFYWCPNGTIDWAPKRMSRTDGNESVVIKTMNPLPAGTPETGSKGDGRYVAPAWRVWPDDYLPNYHEFEYMIPVADGLAAVTQVRNMVQTRFPGETLPLEVRFGGPDDAMLSPFSGRHSCVVSLSGVMGADNRDFFSAAHDLLVPFGARPHWGKAHLFDAAQLRPAFPEFDRFCSIRSELDPDGVFLNDHLRTLFR
jgi:FAD/FMN-containing dehydrogenase